MLRFEEALRPFPRHFMHGVNKKHFTFAGGRLVCSADHDAGFHGRVVEQVWPQPKDTFKQVQFDQFAPHIGFLIAEQAHRAERGWRSGRFWG